MPAIILGTFALTNRSWLPPFIALGEAVAPLWRVSPLAAELLAFYPFTVAAAVLMVALTAWSHHRRSGAVRPQSLLLPTYLAALEACSTQYGALSCGGRLAAPTRAEMHSLLHQAAFATAVATIAPLVIAAILMRVAAGGVSGRMARLHWLSASAATASVLLIWLLYDALFFWPLLWPGP